jgi:hypothetical protein
MSAKTVTVTLTGEELEKIESLKRDANVWMNKLFFLAEVAKNGGNGLGGITPDSFEGLGLILDEISVGLCGVRETLSPVIGKEA